MVLQSHRAIFDCSDHDVLPRKCCSPGRSRDEPRGTLKGVPIKVRIENSNALRDVRLLSICTFAEIMSRENLQRAPPPSLMGRIATGIDLFRHGATAVEAGHFVSMPAL